MRTRAWDKLENRFRLSTEFTINGDGVIFCKNYDPLRLRKIWSKCESKRVVVQQATGIYDITGKEIYEGDKVEYGDNWTTSIIFYKGSFCLDSGKILLGESKYEIKVIGHIYDNKA